MSIRNRLIPVFAILLAGLVLRIIRTSCGLQWKGYEKVLYLVLLSAVLWGGGRLLFRMFDKRQL